MEFDERHEFLPDEKTVLTRVSDPCKNGAHVECGGLLKIEGKQVWCVCVCHLMPSEI